MIPNYSNQLKEAAVEQTLEPVPCTASSNQSGYSTGPLDYGKARLVNCPAKYSALSHINVLPICQDLSRHERNEWHTMVTI